MRKIFAWILVVVGAAVFLYVSYNFLPLFLGFPDESGQPARIVGMTGPLITIPLALMAVSLLIFRLGILKLRDK